MGRSLTHKTYGKIDLLINITLDSLLSLFAAMNGYGYLSRKGMFLLPTEKRKIWTHWFSKGVPQITGSQQKIFVSWNLIITLWRHNSHGTVKVETINRIHPKCNKKWLVPSFKDMSSSCFFLCRHKDCHNGIALDLSMSTRQLPCHTETVIRVQKWFAYCSLLCNHRLINIGAD